MTVSYAPSNLFEQSSRCQTALGRFNYSCDAGGRLGKVGKASGKEGVRNQEDEDWKPEIEGKVSGSGLQISDSGLWILRPETWNPEPGTSDSQPWTTLIRQK